MRSKTDEIKSIPNYKDLKLDKELTKKVCKDVRKSIEKDKTLTKEQKKDLSKMSLSLEILKSAFSLDDNEINEVKKDIEFFYNNHLIQKKVFRIILKPLSKVLELF